MIDTELSWLS